MGIGVNAMKKKLIISDNDNNKGGIHTYYMTMKRILEKLESTFATHDKHYFN